jgi:hypothetical protein
LRVDVNERGVCLFALRSVALRQVSDNATHAADSRISAVVIQHGEQLYEGSSCLPIPLRCDFDAALLRELAQGSRDPDQTRRLLALASYDTVSG